MAERKTPVPTCGERVRIEDEGGATIWWCSLKPNHNDDEHVAFARGYRGDDRVWVMRWRSPRLSTQPVHQPAPEPQGATS